MPVHKKTFKKAKKFVKKTAKKALKLVGKRSIARLLGLKTKTSLKRSVKKFVGSRVRPAQRRKIRPKMRKGNVKRRRPGLQ